MNNRDTNPDLIVLGKVVVKIVENFGYGIITTNLHKLDADVKLG